MCGGTNQRLGQGRRLRGLSPRVRGNLGSYELCCGWEGSIPACAGEPLGHPGRRRRAAVYPRVCGGTLASMPSPRPGRGLSPRVRGNPALIARRPAWSRSIPACAGEPQPEAASSGQRRVYPRVCGGTRRWRACTTGGRGLSPRVRGNHGQRGAGECHCGSIPACAGEPAECRSDRRMRAVYPRVCGGTA